MTKQHAYGTAAPRVILALALGMVLVIAAGTGAFYFIGVKAPTDLAHNAKEESFDAASRVANGFNAKRDRGSRVGCHPGPIPP